MDFAKRLLDYGFHAPTTYFPLLVAECFLIEPTETDSEWVNTAPHTLPVSRLDDVKAARELDLTHTAPER